MPPAARDRDYSVGDLAAATGLSPRVLRHWESLGVISAHRTGGNQRSYPPAQVTRLYRALALRRTGLPLARVAALLDASDPDPAATLRAHLDELEVDLAARARLRDRLAQALADPTDPAPLTRVIATMTMFDQYVHGYRDEEGRRLADQAAVLEDLLHHGPQDATYPPGSTVLEVGCGVGVQTDRLLRDHPGIDLLAIDLSESSLAAARDRVGDAARFRLLDVTDLSETDLPEASVDHVYCCFVLEHLRAPVEVVTRLRRALRPGGTMTLVEGDHGSTFFHPDSAAAREVVDCQVRLQAEAGGDALIGRRLGPLLREAGFEDVNVTPRQVYVDAARPALVDGFTRRTFTAMVAGVREQAVAAGLIDPERFDQGVVDLLRTTEADGVFCYTFFRAVASR